MLLIFIPKIYSILLYLLYLLLIKICGQRTKSIIQSHRSVIEKEQSEDKSRPQNQDGK